MFIEPAHMFAHRTNSPLTQQNCFQTLNICRDALFGLSVGLKLLITAEA